MDISILLETIVLLTYLETDLAHDVMHSYIFLGIFPSHDFG